MLFHFFPPIGGRAGRPWSTAVFRSSQNMWPWATPLLGRFFGSPRALGELVWAYPLLAGYSGCTEPSGSARRVTAHVRTVHSAPATLNAFEARPQVEQNTASIAWRREAWITLPAERRGMVNS
jgi:hypothetical protein